MGALRRLLVVSLVAAGCGGEPARAPTPTAPPDILLVVVDTLRADHLGIYGYDRPTSPHIDALARRGAWYTRAYAQSGWTMASFASLLTGLLPHQHRVVRDGRDPTRYGHLSPEIPTLAESLRDAGYSTGAVVNNTFLAPEFGLNRGFQRWDWVGSDQDGSRDARDSVKAALSWLDTQTGPTFLMIHFMDPHVSYNPPEDLRGTFAPRDQSLVHVPFRGVPDILGRDANDRSPPPADVVAVVTGLYDEEILGTDRAIGDLVEGLRADGRLDRALIVLTADHGEELWDHGHFEHGHTLYGELTHVPLIVVNGPLQGEVHTLVQHLDVYQALLRRGGAARPQGTGGLDLFDVQATRAPYAISENCLYGPDRAAIVDERARMTVNLQNGAGEVWAVAADGSELTRLQGEEQKREGDRLLPLLMGARGGLAPIPASGSTVISTRETFQQLKALGYLDDRPPGD